MSHYERPLRRVNPSGKVRWVARYSTGRKTEAGLPERRSAGSFAVRGPCRSKSPTGDCCAQHAIDTAYASEAARPAFDATVGAYAKEWLALHPRSARTNVNYLQRLRRVLDLQICGQPFRRWPMEDVKRRHVKQIIDILIDQGRAHRGVVGIVRVLSAMWQDAIDDETVSELNPFLRPRLRASDPRIRKAPREIRVWSWEQMRDFARAAAVAKTPIKVVALRGESESGRGVSSLREGPPSEIDRWRPVYAEAMVRTVSDTGIRLGELLALRRADFHDGHLEIRRTAHDGGVLQGTKIDHGESSAGRIVPVPAGLAALLEALPRRIDTPLMFPTPRGCLWRESAFYEKVWRPAARVAGIDPRPHEMRHSYISLIAASRQVDDATLAQMAGHTVQTMIEHYTHPTGVSFDAVRGVVGG